MLCAVRLTMIFVLFFILFSGFSMSHVMLLSLLAILCTVLYRASTHWRTLFDWV